MKKLLTGIMALTLMLTTAVSAAEYKITAPRTEQIQEGTYEEEIQTADVSMMVSTAVLGLTDTKDVFAQINIETKNDKPSVATLKLTIPEEKVAEGDNAIDYMDLKIALSDGSVVFEEDKDTEKGKNEQSILLGIVNEDGEDYSDTLDIYISANDDMKLSELANKPSDVEWIIELDSNEDVVAAAKKTLSDDEEKPGKTINITVDKTTDKDDGKVAAGDYGFIGKGKCTITTPDGKRDVSFTLSDKASEAVYVKLKEGDKITITGDKDAKLELINASKTTTTTKANNATKTNSKTNPKTGDSSQVALVSVVALLAVVAMTYAARNKKRED